MAALRFAEEAFESDPVTVARELIGAWLWRVLPDGRRVGGQIIETEAYWGEQDLACHARFGRTSRSMPLYGKPGGAYIYLIYGMYWMLNVVTEPENTPSAVLIRALQPTAETACLDRWCCRGPGKLCRALEITGGLLGADMINGEKIWLEQPTTPFAFATSPRIGVQYAGAWAQQPWRFFVSDSPFVSGQYG